jgi:hypothetical protein
MKKRHGVFFGFAVLLITAIFTLAGCDTNGGDSVDDLWLGDSFKLDAQLSIGKLENNQTETTVVYSDLTEINGTITAYAGEGILATGGVTNGKFSLTITEPPSTNLNEVKEDFFEAALEGMWEVTISSGAGVKFVPLTLMIGDAMVDNSKTTYSMKGSAEDSVVEFTSEGVAYYYFNNDLTLNLKGKSFDLGLYKMASENTILKFKKGWNAIYMKGSGKGSLATSVAVKTTLSLGDRKLYWLRSSDDLGLFD